MGNKVNGVWIVEHETTCDCGADLTQPASVDVQFSNGDSTLNMVESQVSSSGILADPTGQIGLGQHAGSYCTKCGDLLDEG